MKTSVKKIDEYKSQLSIEAASETVKKKFDEVYLKLSQEIKVPGFRPGKAPRSILEKNYAHLAQERVINELVPELCDDAIKKEGLEVIALSAVEDVQLKSDSLSFKALVELKPKIQIKDYRKIKLVYKRITVNEEDIKNAKENIKKARNLTELNDQISRSLGYPDLLALEEYLRHSIYVEKESGQRSSLENQIIDKLLKENDFLLPQTMVKRQLEDMLSRYKAELLMRGLPKEDIEKEEENIAKRLEPEAERQVKLYLILEAIAKKEGIELNNEMPRKVIELIFCQADWVTQ